MNLAILEKMVGMGDMSSDALRYLLDCRGECEWLDFKEVLQLDNEKQSADFARDVLAFKNVGGGYIVVGVVDKSWEPKGVPSRLPYDTKMLRDKIRSTTGLELAIDLVHHELTMEGNVRLFPVIHIRASKKRSRRRTPTIPKKDFAASKPYGLRQGEIYARRGDSTIRIKSQEELDELLARIEGEADEASLEGASYFSPFALSDGFYRLLEKGFENFVGRDKLRDELRQAVTKDPRIWIINVHGPGGVGKSALVNWVVYDFFEKRQFESIIQLTAKDTSLQHGSIRRVTRSLYSLENLLDHIINTFGERPSEDLDQNRALAIDILSTYSVLLVLDNMETVTDGRILNFVRELPTSSLAKVLLTSRQKTGGWELPVPVRELDKGEVAKFVEVKSAELGAHFPLDDWAIDRVVAASGGLPLAIQWMIGRYKVKPNIEAVAKQVTGKDSPVLEFSFRNIWSVLNEDARTVLGVMSIFDEPATVSQLSIALEWKADRIEKALAELQEVTLVTSTVQKSDGRVVFIALPITLSFARHQLQTMGDLELSARRRLQTFNNQMSLQESEVRVFTSIFDRFAIEDENEKRAVILSRRAESEFLVGNADNGDHLLRRARDLAPQSAYVLSVSAKCELEANHIGSALEFAEEACRRSNKRTGVLAYSVLAKVHDAKRDRYAHIAALRKVVEFEPTNSVARHQLGVALSRAGQNDDALVEFSRIIDEELVKQIPGKQLFYALKSKVIVLKRSKREQEMREALELAGELIRRFPHMESEALHFAEFQ